MGGSRPMKRTVCAANAFTMAAIVVLLVRPVLGQLDSRLPDWKVDQTRSDMESKIQQNQARQGQDPQRSKSDRRHGQDSHHLGLGQWEFTSWCRTTICPTFFQVSLEVELPREFHHAAANLIFRLAGTDWVSVTARRSIIAAGVANRAVLANHHLRNLSSASGV
jgi:hypothetical protein